MVINRMAIDLPIPKFKTEEMGLVQNEKLYNFRNFRLLQYLCIGIDVSDSKIDKIPGKDSIELLINNL